MEPESSPIGPKSPWQSKPAVQITALDVLDANEIYISFRTLKLMISTLWLFAFAKALCQIFNARL